MNPCLNETIDDPVCLITRRRVDEACDVISNVFTPSLILCSFPEDFCVGWERCSHSLLFYICHGPSSADQWRANGSRSQSRPRKWWIHRSRRRLVSTNCSIYFNANFSSGTCELNVIIIAEISSNCN